MASVYHVNPRIRAYGKARIDVTRRARDEKEWQDLWREPLNKFPFALGDGWKFTFEYSVDDYAAEVGFFIDILGFEVHAFSPSYARFLIPGGGFGFTISAFSEGSESTPPDSIRLQFCVEDIVALVKTLESRGVTLEGPLARVQEGSSLLSGYFRSPHGVCIDLIGEAPAHHRLDQPLAAQPAVEDQRSLLDEFLSMPDAELDDDTFLEGGALAAAPDEDAAPGDDDLPADVDDPVEPEYVDEGDEDELDPVPPAPIALEFKESAKTAGASPFPRKRSQNSDAGSFPKTNRHPPFSTSQSGVSGSAYRSSTHHGQLVYDELDPGSEVG